MPSHGALTCCRKTELFQYIDCFQNRLRKAFCSQYLWKKAQSKAQSPLTRTEQQSGAGWDVEAGLLPGTSPCWRAVGTLVTFACSVSCSCHMSSKGRRQCERSSRISMTSCPGQGSGMSPRMTFCHPDLFYLPRLKCSYLADLLLPGKAALLPTSKESKVGDTQAGSADLLCVRGFPHLTLGVLFLPRTLSDDGDCLALLQ